MPTLIMSNKLMDDLRSVSTDSLPLKRHYTSFDFPSSDVYSNNIHRSNHININNIDNNNNNNNEKKDGYYCDGPFNYSEENIEKIKSIKFDNTDHLFKILNDNISDKNLISYIINEKFNAKLSIDFLILTINNLIDLYNIKKDKDNNLIQFKTSNFNFDIYSKLPNSIENNKNENKTNDLNLSEHYSDINFKLKKPFHKRDYSLTKTLYLQEHNNNNLSNNNKNNNNKGITNKNPIKIVTEQDRKCFQMFNLKKPPSITIKSYLLRINRFLKCSPTIYLSTSYLIFNLIYTRFGLSFPVTLNNVFRIIITSLNISLNLIEDLNFKKKFFCQIGGISISELTRLQLNFLYLMEFNTWLSPSKLIDHLVDATLLNKKLLAIKQLLGSH
ncbi:uncharacterized protein ASCRUDRAFT_142651 [Ascoidea rubescens DSM 1968]|uniref:Cyclin-domain-containing protein n=1 Tax=Ascoidea rubescens DSM 1968 TaxID=1344418 RepID=A0A1D2VIM8_9ASCO|nr:hypothetical protein ASCRUDRAFT_142651 [Ascoidea rubescens DSM 1968]ODV61491.1 hypothetical protein ASCRUDRAFT_142651 [Ascoidea rubescens DSM 1968]